MVSVRFVLSANRTGTHCAPEFILFRIRVLTPLNFPLNFKAGPAG